MKKVSVKKSTVTCTFATRSRTRLKTSLCTFCIKSGMLCPRCQEKVKSGEVTDVDISVAKLLIKMEDKYPALQKINFHNAFEIDHVLAIVVGNGDLEHFHAGGGNIMRELADETRKKIRMFEKKGDNRRFLEDLFAPAAITTINKIWLPDGTTETKVVLSGYPKKLPLKTSVLKDVAKRVRDVTLRIAFEGQPGKDF